MSTARKGAIAMALAAALALFGAAGCGEEHSTDVKEGEPLELGDIAFNVQLTRFLNPADAEDSAYLQGQPPPADDQDYLAVFMEVENHGDEEATLPAVTDMTVEDTTGQTYNPVAVAADNVFMLDLGGPIPEHETVPIEDTPAAEGPAEGSIVLFLVDAKIGENRPLELEIDSEGDKGRIELDI